MASFSGVLRASYMDWVIPETKKALEIRGFSLARWWGWRELNPMPHLSIGPQKTTIAHKTDAYKNGIPHITTQNRSCVDTLWTLSVAVT